jgi:thymidylate synthase
MGEYPNLMYKQVIRNIMTLGDKVSPRGKLTYELQPAVHHLTSPAKKLSSTPGRKANPFFSMAESLWIIAGRGDSEWVSTFNNKLNEFQLDEGHTDYNAPYGRRIRFANKHRAEELTINKINFFNMKKIPQVDQLLHCYLSLKKDPDSRQAVVSLWNPLIDYVMHETKDRPCNTTIYFKIREKKLNMTVCNRSNDVHLGLYGVNFVQFSRIQEFMAASLNVGIGKYTHFSDSLHIYDDSQHTKNILESKYDFDIYEMVEPKILTYELFCEEFLKYQSFDQDPNIKPNLNDFLSIADQVIDESLNFRKNGFSSVATWCKTDYALNCYRYLVAYDYYKQGNYEAVFEILKTVFEYGFKDWAILGLEFCMRNEKFKEFTGQSSKLSDFITSNFETSQVVRIIQYLHNH